MTIEKIFVILLLVAPLAVVARAGDHEPAPLPVVPSLDLARYAGRYYEIARLPNRFQKGCAGEVTATYTLLENGQLRVVNECRTEEGGIDRAEGRARLADSNGPASKLKVRFAPRWLSWLPAVWGDYWIIDLASDYSHALVGTPDRKYLWILAREPRVDDAVYREIVDTARAAGFDVERLIQTRQSL